MSVKEKLRQSKLFCEFIFNKSYLAPQTRYSAMASALKIGSLLKREILDNTIALSDISSSRTYIQALERLDIKTMDDLARWKLDQINRGFKEKEKILFPGPDFVFKPHLPEYFYPYLKDAKEQMQRLYDKYK